MSIVNQIIEGVGTKVLCTNLKVLPTAISNAKSAQAFPAHWFLVIRRFAVDLGIDIEANEFLLSFTFKHDAGFDKTSRPLPAATA